MVGLSAHTIRAWERRYEAVVPARSPTRQRRYLLDEVETLKRIKDLASARGLSLRLAVAEAMGELPELEGAPSDAPSTSAEPAGEDGGPWRAVADLATRVILLVDQQGRVADCNVAFARLTGYLRFQVRGRRFADLVDPYDRGKAVAIYRGAPQPRLGWELNLLTAAEVGLFSFDCIPFRYRDSWLIACTGRGVS